ncbi:Pyrroline-5-carboxylate reductase [Zancudomyces culisetae]|uniref:Pyrroline-5-carboxylate reductase n=1 Tax=Zancudomyces culisetae TaxID=1213189 RepID=A0A1R1PG10_ZANCU|nr:Pyrroline-5-carboxylate reductase [Zancudomyces culisetae]|eukprot:OMH79930.1 Pyrroline-5-carboxylate reductase [Zancudomyces culisetae]
MVGKNICLIGGGNMGESIIAGLIQGGHDKGGIYVADPYQPRLEYLKKTYGVFVTTSNIECLNGVKNGKPDIIIIATKPSYVPVVISETRDILKRTNPLLMSIAAGVSSSSIYNWASDDEYKTVAVVRMMPNTPALVNEGAAGLISNEYVTPEQKALAETVAKNLSKYFFWFKTDRDIDSVTAISGSGPAYFFYVMEAMEKAAVEMGLDKESSRKLIAQTCIGAGKMVLGTDKEISELRAAVTSPNGTTHAAIESMKADSVGEHIAKGCHAAKARSIELSKM